MVASWPPSAIPTDYWIRPVSPDNREWWTISGNYPWNGMGLSYFDPEAAKWQELYPNTNPYWSAQERFTHGYKHLRAHTSYGENRVSMQELSAATLELKSLHLVAFKVFRKQATQT